MRCLTECKTIVRIGQAESGRLDPGHHATPLLAGVLPASGKPSSLDIGVPNTYLFPVTRTTEHKMTPSLTTGSPAAILPDLRSIRAGNASVHAAGHMHHHTGMHMSMPDSEPEAMVLLDL